MTVTLVLFVYAMVVATVAPRLVGGSWQLRSPRLALGVWHATGASVLLALVLAGVSCLATPGLVAACLRALTGRDDAAGLLTVGLGLVVPVLLAARVAAVWLRIIKAERAARARHVEILSLIGRREPGLDAVVIPAERPAAYCVPGIGRIVLTEAAIALLSEPELRAVLAHERAHLAGRHHLLVTWASALTRAFPGVPVFRALHGATRDIVELIADDNAVRRESGDSLAEAIGMLGVGPDLTLGLAAVGGSVLVRVHRLLDPPRPLPALSRVGGVGAAVSLVALPGLLVALPVVAAACPFMIR